MLNMVASYIEITKEQINSLIASTSFECTSEERTRLCGILQRLFDETEPDALAATPQRRSQVGARGRNVVSGERSDPFASPATIDDASLLGTGERPKRPTPGEQRKGASGSKPLPAGVESVGSDYEDERSKNPARPTTRRREDDDFDDLFAGSGSTGSRRGGTTRLETGQERRERDLAVAAEERRLRDLATTGMHDDGDGIFEFAVRDDGSGEPSTQPPPPGEGSLGTTTSTHVVSPPPLPLQAGGYSPTETPLEASRDTGVHLPVAKRPEPKASSRVTNPLQSGNPLAQLDAAAAAASSPPPLPRQQVDDGNDSGYSTPDDVVAVLAPNPFVVPESDTTEL
jgi:hypothetical protein